MIVIIFDRSIVFAWRERCVAYFVAFLNFRAIHGDFAGAVDGDGERADPGVAGIDDEVGLVAGLDVLQAISVGVDSGRVGGVLADPDVVRRARYVDAVEFHMDLVDTVFARHETNRILLDVDQLDEAIVFVAGWGYDL